MSRKIPKVASITEIKGRLKKKENELLSMFDDVEGLDNKRSRSDSDEEKYENLK